jgi:hypothetical protein
MKRKTRIGLKIRCKGIQAEGRQIIEFIEKWNRSRKHGNASSSWISKEFSLGLSGYRLWYSFPHPTGTKAYDYSPYFIIKTVLWKKEELF